MRRGLAPGDHFHAERGDLSRNGTRGACGTRHHGCFAGFDLANVRYPEICCEAVEAEQAQRKVERHARRKLLYPAEGFSIGCSIILPAEVASHEVTRLEVRMTRLEYLPDGEGLHDLAKRNLRFVRVTRHPDALRGIDRQPQVPDQHLSIGGLWN